MILSIEVSKYALLLSPLVACLSIIFAIMFYQRWSFDRANEECQESIRDLEDIRKIQKLKNLEDIRKIQKLKNLEDIRKIQAFGLEIIYWEI